MKAEAMPRGLQVLVHLVDRLAERWKGLFLPLLALSILGLPGCMEDEGLASGTLGAEAIDSGGVVIVSNQASSDERPLLVVADEPVVSIGDQRPLYQVQGAIRTVDGRIVVADRGSGALLFFGEDGSLMSTAGGPGEGPGEFRSLGKPIPYRGDSILVHDGAVGRITVFDEQGRGGSDLHRPRSRLHGSSGSLS